MFLLWEGFEIDGSDTDFDLVLPETQELIAFVDCFLSLPLVREAKFNCHYSSGPPKFKKIPLSRQKLAEVLTDGRRPEIYLEVTCQVTDELPEAIRAELRQLSERREPQELAYGKAKCPCMAPALQVHHMRGELSVSLCIMPPGTKKRWYTEEGAELEGYVRNEAILVAKEELPCLVINVGPGFYYEYAMYIMNWLEDHFPGLGIAGGLDCEGGWTGGCTYANSIYQYEKIQLPIKYSITNTLKRLTEYDLLRSFRRYYKKGWKYEMRSDFSMVNIPQEKWVKPYLLSYTDYAAHIEKVLAEEADYFSAISQTAIAIILPMPSRFEQFPKIKHRLLQALTEVDDVGRGWYFEGYAAFSQVNGQPVCEYRVPWQVGNYLSTLLELVESGELDWMKTEAYERRMQENGQN